jgi:hypothetical protein
MFKSKDRDSALDVALKQRNRKVMKLTKASMAHGSFPVSFARRTASPGRRQSHAIRTRSNVQQEGIIIDANRT